MSQIETTPNTYLSDEALRSLVNGLSRIEGHVRAVKRMVEQRRCCDEILTQTAAVRSALNSIAVKLVEEELVACLTSCAQPDAEQRMAQAMRAVSSMLKHG
ncbi:MAG: metal-sensitive transcriptional regulator [Planctomycetes bacterium]|nr:metal-sensitive transcriptional regulator [Planctomycetota bacterium]